jgi:hypothetical protein
MDIFESLENLNVSEECFDEIMGLVEELLSEEDVYEPAAYAKDGYNFMATGSNKLNGKLYKVHTKHDKGVTKTKLYAKDGDSARKLVQKAYGGPDSAHTLANESLYNEIADLVEELLSEEGFLDKVTDKITNSKNKIVSTLRRTPLVKNTIGKRAVQKAQDNLRSEISNTKAYTNSQIEYNKARGANPSARYKDAAQQGQNDVSAAKDHYLGVGDRYGFKKNELLK